ncbi:hypothetical protein HS088_TW11G00639 [Tripterygium wilfordii]|uniref:J domain-containing protein n=1 Tax=Tripterygium wilfordii TaxID=458696 RepID=A0A7J7D2I0_TRIWF|nr:uncharacterized protein LOC120008980 [Tripterygium wilfordii]KAF5740565.1 hypothetical protein HS088_TW11G00639 [Tripterygium wilfordii]
MECNKEEAIRAKEMAEKRMAAGDFLGAKKIALKAQKLYQDLENITQLLTVCDVHCSALNKVNGSDMDWYGILQVERFSDDAAIKKQYRKLALSLHPDKNKFAGAEAAFKLIGEANRLLTDNTQRLLFDMKLKHSVITAATKQPTHQKNMNPSVSQQSTTSRSFAYAPYTQFSSSGFSGPYAPFMSAPYAQFTRAAPGSQQSQPPNQKGVANQGPSKVASQGNGANPPGTFVAVNFTGVCGISKPGEKANQHMNVAAGNVGHAARPKESGTSYGMGRKRRKKLVEEESDDSSETASSRISEDMVNEEIYDTGHQPRRSRRQRQNVSYKENVSDDDDYANSPAMTRGNSSFSNNEERNEAPLDDGVHKDIKSSSSTGSMAGHGEDVKKKASTIHEESLANKESRTGEDGGKDENINMSDNNNSKSEDDADLNEHFPEKPEAVQYPDPEFGDFDKDKAKHCFDVNQIWAIYDPIDGMPRFYARVKKLFSPGFRLRITWLEPVPDDEVEQEWCDAELPVACGKYVTGSTEEIDAVQMFSHKICVNRSVRSSYLIYPRQGETWALFKNWSLKWRSDPNKHRPPYQFEYVKILSDFVENVGVTVSYLRKVGGFVSLFHGTNQLRLIPIKDLYKFSHRVPSFIMTGEEKKGVPAGSFELDPAALLFDHGLDDPGKVKMENADSLGAQTKQTS